MTESLPPPSVLGLQPRTPLAPGIVLAVLLHVVVFGAALVLPKFFDRAPPLRKPIIAKLVALGKPRDPHLLPRKESPPPAAAASPVAVPSSKPSSAPAPRKREPTRQELMQRALARAAGKTEPKTEEPDPERAGSATGSPQGTAATAEEGDAYFTAVHDAILENYVVPSVISERERLYLSASVLAWIGANGQILKHEFEKKSGNAFFDQALELAIQRTKLPPPPAEIAKSLRDTGVVLNFKP
ncbi:MAG: energy transducer TonB [Myxococcales bacterium]|nr:TonB C-terminal domain-containing protein [Myxococcales bacterium]